jgi:adenosylhomocysteinase
MLLEVSPSVDIRQDIIGQAYDYLAEVVDVIRPKKDTGIILVAHSYATVFALVGAVQNMGNLRGVVLKHATASRFPEIGTELSRLGVPVLNISKERFIHDMSRVANEIDRAVPCNERLVIMDHGGYFAHDDTMFKRFAPDRLIGAVEHTENGHKRYASLNITDRPIVSISRSHIKIPSDEAAADQIFKSAETYLIEEGISFANPKFRVGIIGYGRLGAQIGHTLGSKGVPRVLVNDLDSSRLVTMRQHAVANKEDLVKRCNIIFCATGNNALLPEHFSMLQKDSVIFGVTSPDDELNLPKLIKDGVLIPSPLPETSNREKYAYRVRATGHEIFLPFNGESPNTSSKYGIPEPIVHQTYAAHMTATMHVMGNNPPANGLTPLLASDEQMVSRLWLNHFGVNHYTDEAPERTPASNRRPRSARRSRPLVAA